MDATKWMQTCVALGRWQAGIEQFNYRHTCDNSHLRYPWPLDKECAGCRHDLERFVRAEHIEIPYKLFGWEATIDHYLRYLERFHNQREARLQVGAYI